jgi:hypothetical protein
MDATNGTAVAVDGLESLRVPLTRYGGIAGWVRHSRLPEETDRFTVAETDRFPIFLEVIMTAVKGASVFVTGGSRRPCGGRWSTTRASAGAWRWTEPT